MRLEEKKEENKTLDLILNIIKGFLTVFLVLVIVTFGFQKLVGDDFNVGNYKIYTVGKKHDTKLYKTGDMFIVEKVDTETLLKGDKISYLGIDGSTVVTEKITDIVDDELGTAVFIVGEDKQIGDDVIFGKVVYKSVLFSFLSKLVSNVATLLLSVLIPVCYMVLLKFRGAFKSSKVKKLEKELESDLDNDTEDDDDDDEESQRVIQKYYE